MNSKHVLLAASALAALLAAPAAYSQWYYPGWVRPYPRLVYPYAYGPRYYPYPRFHAPPYYAASGQRRYEESSQVSHARIEPPRMERMVLSARELFDFDKAKVHGSQPKLDEIAEMMKRDPGIELSITGYTDRIGTESYNQKLSERRAQAVKDYLVARGVGPERLIAAGKGQANPVADCDDGERADLVKCLEPNRRVEVEEIVIERQVPQG